MRGLDLARLSIRQAYLAEVEAQDATLAGAHLAQAILAEAFNYPTAVALSADGALLAAGTYMGEVCLWRVADRTPLMAVHGHDGVVHGVLLKGMWHDIFGTLHMPMGDPGTSFVYYALYDLAKGVAAVTVYAAIRPRFGPGLFVTESERVAQLVAKDSGELQLLVRGKIEARIVNQNVAGRTRVVREK